MWPWGHLAVGYLVYSLYTHVVHRRHPAHSPAVTLALATQIPDLVDKPLAYWVGVIPEGRSLAHSLLIAVPVWLLIWQIAARRDTRQAGTAFVIGYLTHLAGDSYRAFLAGRFADASFLLWPVLAPPDYATHSFAQHWTQLLASLRDVTLHGVLTGELPAVAYQVLLAGLVTVIWITDGTPGLQPVLGWIQLQHNKIFD